MLQGKLNKARRGELSFPLPIGYVRRPSGEVTLDPDEQVQQVIRLIFRKFEELGTLNAVLRYLVEHKIQLGIRVRTLPSKGELEWHRPNRMTLQNLLKSPIYAGAYAYGRRRMDPRKQQAGKPFTGRTVTAPENWYVLLQDRFPAYISWEQYQQNLAKLKSNRARADERGAVRHGPSLLSGLLICGKCGCRMTVQYSRGQHLRYLCCRQAVDYGGEVCQQLAGVALDQFVTQQVLTALEPAALELSLEAATHLEQERAELDRLWQQRLERANFEAERAGRHYRLVEPENRMVARHLAREWEEKLAEKQQLQEDYQRCLHQQARLLSEMERAAIRQLSENIPALWSASTTTNAQRKEIVRQVVNRIIVDVQGETERVQITLEWVGGSKTQDIMIRPVGKLSQLSYYPQLCERISQLAALGLRAAAIARQLNAEGFHPAKNYPQFGRQGVADLMRRLGLRRKRSSELITDGLGDAEWWLPELARTLLNANHYAVWLGAAWLGQSAPATTATRALDCLG